MNTAGISGDDHHGFALMDPKMNPTYPCSRNADGMPTMVTIQPTCSSTASASGLTFFEPSVMIWYTHRSGAFAVAASSTISLR